MTEDTTTDDGNDAPEGESSFRIGRVLTVLIPLVLLAFLGFGFIAMDGQTWVARLLRPPLAPAKGSVFYKGKPVVDATIMTSLANGTMPGALGQTDEYGEFVLQTDIRGTYEQGAYTGKHKLTVAVYEVNPGPGAASLKTPGKFASMADTPLTVEVVNGGLNEFRIRLDDYLEEGEGVEPGSESAGLVATMFTQYDKDESGTLSMEELDGVPEQWRDNVKQADTDGDGQVDRTELGTLMRNRPRRSPDGPRRPAPDEPSQADSKEAQP